jgi:hypothetical protein
MATAKRSNSDGVLRNEQRYAISILLFLLLIGFSVYLVQKSADLLQGLDATMTVVVFVVAAVAATTVVSGLLSSTGIWKTSHGKFGGAAAVCLGMISAEMTAYRVVKTHEPWRLIGRIDGLPQNVDAEVMLNGTQGPCRSPVDKQTAFFQIPVREDCDEPQLEIRVSPKGFKQYGHAVDRKQAAAHQEIVIPWQAEPTTITGRVIEKGGLPAAGATLALHAPGCDVQTRTDGAGAFQLNMDAAACGPPPLPVKVNYNGVETDVSLTGLVDNQLEVPVVIHVGSVKVTENKVLVELVGTLTFDDFAMFHVGHGLWVVPNDNSKIGEFYGDEAPRRGDRVSVSGLTPREAADLLKTFKLNVERLQALHEVAPDFAPAVDMMVGEYIRLANLSGGTTCTELGAQLRHVQKGLTLRPTDPTLVAISRRNQSLRQVGGC